MGWVKQLSGVRRRMIMQIGYVDGNRLFNAFIAGGNAIINDIDYLNKINVFPVPDSDTGSNLASTMRSIVEGTLSHRSLNVTVRSMVDSALSGARGNSGLIFAQFLQGFHEGISNKSKLSTRSFSEAVKSAVQDTYQSMAAPVEGTMLTVMNDWAEAVHWYADKTGDFSELFMHALKVARQSLKDTPKKLSVLAQAGVVDAGACGFVDFLEGITHFIKSGRLRNLQRPRNIPRESEIHVHSKWDEHECRYCSEALLTGDDMPLERIRREIISLGDSAIVAGFREKARIHIHTDQPAAVFERLDGYGTIEQIKVDDMLKQYAASKQRKAGIALVTDSACDLPIEYLDSAQIHVIPFRISFGNSLFLDKLTVTAPRFYRMLQTNPVHPRSSQPAYADVRNMLSFLASHYDSVIVVTISSRLTGLFGTAKKVAEELVEKPIGVIDSKQLTGTEGLLVMRVAEAIRAGRSHEEILAEAPEWVSKLRILVDVNTLKYMVRGGRVSPLKGFASRVLNLKPIISLDDGAAVGFGKSFSRRRNMAKIVESVRAMAVERKIWKYALVHAQSPGRAGIYGERLESLLGFPPAFTMDLSPVVGVHNGIGAIGICLMFE